MIIHTEYPQIMLLGGGDIYCFFGQFLVFVKYNVYINVATCICDLKQDVEIAIATPILPTTSICNMMML